MRFHFPDFGYPDPDPRPPPFRHLLFPSRGGMHHFPPHLFPMMRGSNLQNPIRPQSMMPITPGSLDHGHIGILDYI